MPTDSGNMSRAALSKHMNLEHLSDEECEKILRVLQKDFELRDKERERLHKIEESLKEEEEKTEVIAVKTKLNEEVCVRCCQKFGIIFNRKQLCLTCKHYVCKRCAVYNDNEKGYTCHACIKERELKLKSFEWFYNNVSSKFKRFGSAKVVRSLYKQRGARGRAYHTDNESDTGYDPSFLASLRSGARDRGFGGLPDPEDERGEEEDSFNSDGEREIESIGPAPITTTTVSRASSVNVLNHDNKKNYNNNNNNSSSSTAEVQVDNIPKEKSKEDIYKEAFEHYKETEEKKFNYKFDSLLRDLYQSLEQPVLNGGSSYGSTSYGEVLEKYRLRLRELLVGVSQRLEMAVESFDSSPSQSVVDTAQKVKKLVSKLVEESFGESIDVTSDEAVSDLSSLSDDSCDHQVKSFEDQLAHAVVARVLENFGRDRNIDIPLDFIDGNALTNQVSDGRSHASDNKSHPDLASRGASSDEENSVVTKVERRSLLGYADSGGFDVDELDVNESVSDSENRLHPTEDSVSRDVSRPVHEPLDDSSYEVISVKDLEVENHLSEDLVDGEGVDQRISGEEDEDITTESVHTDNIQQDFEQLKRIAKDIKSPRHEVQAHDIQEEIEFDEEPIEPVTVNRDESKSEFVSRLSTYDRLHDTEKYSLPDFSEDYEDNEFFQNEVDPDLLSMNLAPILEEDEEDFQEEENEEGASLHPRFNEERSWRDNWIFNKSGLSPFPSLGGGGLAGRSLDEVYLTIPQPDDDITARVGNRDVDQMSDDLSEGHEENLMDDEVSFFAKSVDEIARITTRMTSSSPRPLSTTSVQTVDSDTSVDTSISKYTSTSTAKTEPTYIEELIPAEGDDPKFDIPPESVTVKEGEPAKFSCRVSGTEPIEVIWYRVEDGDLEQLEDSEDYEFTKDHNRHGATVFNTAKHMAGQLMCMAINEKAHCSQSFILKVKSNNQEMKKPEFLKEIEDQEVKEGQHVKFRAKVKGYPLPRVVWYKDGNLLKNDSKFKIEKFGNRDYLLNIEYATPEEDAEYWVVAKNIAGETKSTAQLIVQSKELDSSPKSNVISSTPIKNKDDQQLSNMGRKLFMTHEKVQEESESMMESANKLAEMHSSLDQFDAMLSSFEAEIEVSSTPHPPPPSEFADEDPLLKHDLRKSVENYNSMKDAASNLRNTTSSALQLLKSTENLIHSQPEEDVFTTNSSRESTLSSSSQQDQENNNSMKSAERQTNNAMSVPLTKVPPLDFSEHSEVTDNEPVTSESVIEPASRTLQESLKGSDSSNEDQEFVERSNLSNENEEPMVINFGSKEVSGEMYGRDFYVQGEKKDSPRHWEVKLPQYSPRGGKVMTQESLEATEEEVVSVERQLDLNSCPSIMTGHATEESVSSLSPSLSIDSGFSSIREKPPQTQMIGETSERDIPESRTEFNEEMGAVELPSVNRLKSLFSAGKGDDSASVKRFENVLSSGVHSITGRSVPKEKLDKYRNISSPLTKPVQSPEQPTPGKSTLTVTLSSKHPGTKQLNAEPTQIFPEKKGEFFPDTPQQKTQSVTSTKVVPSTKTKAAPPTPTSQTKLQAAVTPASRTQTDSGSKSNAPGASSVGAQPKGKTRIRSGCITARASFWEKRIHGEETKEEDYPEMVEHVDE